MRKCLNIVLLVCFLYSGIDAHAGGRVLASNDPCPGARPIADARKLPLGVVATVRGIVTVPTGAFTTGQSFALQDATAGIYAYRQGGIGQTLAAGDEVCITGRLTEFHGLRELVPVARSQVTRIGRGAAPAPLTIAPREIGEATEGRLVSVTGLVSRLGQKRFRVGEAAIFLEEQAGIAITGLQEGCPATVVGLSADFDGPQVWPRSQADIVPGACPTPPAACPDSTVAQLQGAAVTTPYDAAARFRCLDACVTGVAGEGFFVQSLIPDADSRTSEGIYVFRYSAWQNPRGLRPGDRVTLRNFSVQEFYGQTEIVKLADDTEASYRVSGRCDLPAAVLIPTLSDPTADPTASYEPFEGMRVRLSFDGSVVGPTARYVSRYPAGDPEIVLADRVSPFYGQRILASELQAGRGTLALSGGLGIDLPAVGVFDRVRAQDLTGVLAYQFGQFVLLVDDPSPLQVSDTPDVVNAAPAGGPDGFALCTFNAENLFDLVDDLDGDVGDWSPRDEGEYGASLAKRGRAIREALRGCTVVAMQEVEGKDAVWARLAEIVGPGWRADYFESADVRDITVGLLYDAAHVTLRRSDQAQACTAVDYQVDYAFARGPRGRPNPCSTGTFPLFDRPPYVADLTVRDAAGDQELDLRVVVVHLKSKRGEERLNAPRRAAQARFVATLLTEPLSVALGDFNDGLGSETLGQFPGMVNLFERHVAPADRYTYIYQGRAEAIDHVIMTPGLDACFVTGSPIHINADYPEPLVPDATSHRSSDHDPLFARFAFRPTGVSDALIGAVTGGLFVVGR